MTDTTPYLRASSLGQPDGIATLDGTGNVPADQLANAGGGGGGGPDVVVNNGKPVSSGLLPLALQSAGPYEVSMKDQAVIQPIPPQFIVSQASGDVNFWPFTDSGSNPTWCCTDLTGEGVWFTVPGLSQVVFVSINQSAYQWVSTIPGSVGQDICFGADGYLYITDPTNTCIYRLQPEVGSSSYSTIATGGAPQFICAAWDGNLYATSNSTDLIKIGPPSTHTTYSGLFSGGDVQGICAGPDGHLWVGDANGAMWRVDISTGTPTATKYTLTDFGSQPAGVTQVCSAPDGCVYGIIPNLISASSAGLVRMQMSGTSTIYDWSDEGVNQYSGGQGLQDIVVGPDGNLYVSDNSLYSGTDIQFWTWYLDDNEVNRFGPNLYFMWIEGDSPPVVQPNPIGMCVSNGQLWFANANASSGGGAVSDDFIMQTGDIQARNVTVTSGYEAMPAGTDDFQIGVISANSLIAYQNFLLYKAFALPTFAIVTSTYAVDLTVANIYVNRVSGATANLPATTGGSGAQVSQWVMFANPTSGNLTIAAHSGSTIGDLTGLSLSSIVLPPGAMVQLSIDTYDQTKWAVTGGMGFRLGGEASMPAASNTVSTSFGSVTINTPKQNSLPYDIIVNMTVAWTGSSSGSLAVGVGPTSTPTTNAVTGTLPTTGVLTITQKVPAGYYLSLVDSGTITISSVTTQACAA